MKKLNKLTMLVLALTLSMSLIAQTPTPPASGDGTSDNPYQIATLDNLYWVTQNSGEWSKYYIQTADIDATSTNIWDGCAGFTPIGNFTINFTGSYNGQNHTIDGLYINRTTTNYQGLFGYTNGATVENIGLTNVNINGDGRIGGLVGENRTSNVNNCYSTGSVSGNERIGGLVGNNRGSAVSNCYSAGSVSGSNYIGGLLGYNYSASSVNNCYSTGSVSGNDYIGGFAGYNSGWSTTVGDCYSTGNVIGNGYVGGLVGYNYSSSTVSNCYSTGSVSGNSYYGGLVGDNSLATVSNSFWDTQTSGQSTSAGGTGKTTAEMKTKSTFTDAGWNFIGETINGANNYWNIDGSINDGYPYLSVGYPASGDGTSGNPYQIATLDNLYWVTQNSGEWSKYYIQTADIDATSTNIWDGCAGFTPIGNFTINFTGSYNGQNHTIDGLYINRTTTNYQGLFGYTNGATVENIGLTNVNINGDGRIGGLVGENRTSNVNNCYSTGSVSGNERIGGLVGNNRGSAVSNCYSAGSVSGSNYIGGLLGYNYSASSVNNCYSTGSVSGDDYIGGFAGQNSGYSTTVSNCYSTGSVSGTASYVGGLVGSNTATVNNSFWDTQTSGQSTSSGGTGKTTAEMKTQSTFTDAGWDFLGETANGENDYWGMESGINNGYPYLTMQKAEWTGASSTLWNLAGNWSVDAIPPAAFDITIPDVVNDPVISGIVATGALTIFPLAQLTIAPMAGLTTNGLFTNDGYFLIQSDGLNGYAGTYIDMAGIAGVGVFEFDRDVLCSGTVGGSANPFGWHYLAAPFDGYTTDDMPDYFVNAWDQPSGLWIQYSMDPYVFPCTPWPTTPLNTMDAWSINFDLNYPDPLCPGLPPGTGNIVEFIGGAVDVHTGAYNAPLGYGAGAYQEWNLVSNPYPSGLDVDLIAWGPNTVQAAAYYDGCAGNYVYWATGMGSYVMAPTLGFFVETVAADVFPVTNAERAHGADWFWKSEVTDLLTLEATGNDKSDVLHVRFADNVTAGFDLNGDAHKLFAENEGLAQIYTLAGEEMLAINAQPAAEMVPMGFTSVGSGTFTIEAIETSDFADVVLEDLFEETQTDLLAGSYTFNYTAGDDPNRFIIHFTPVGTPELEANSINIWSSEHNIYVNVPETANGDIIVFNMMGQEMLRTDINPGCVNVIPMEKVNTYYVVKVLTSKNAVTGKVYIK